MNHTTSLSGDGKIAVGMSAGGEAWRWTEAGGVVKLLPDFTLTLPGCVGAWISRDGRTIVGCVMDAQGNLSAGIWQGGTNWREIGNLGGKPPDPGSVTSAYVVSGDGSIIVGASYNAQGKYHAFRWNTSSGMVDLGALTGEGASGQSRINGISSDGNVLVGWDEDSGLGLQYRPRRAAIWWRGLERLMNPFGWVGEAKITNDVGSVIAGKGFPADYRTTWLHTAWNGQTYNLGALEIGLTPDQISANYSSEPLAMSSDGQVIVG
jgi:probable HAF family extracellular repeat protein